MKDAVSPQIHPKEEGTAAITLPSGTELEEDIREEFEDVEPARKESEIQESPVRHTPRWELHRTISTFAPDEVEGVPSGINSTENLIFSQNSIFCIAPSGRVCAPDGIDEEPDDMDVSRPV